MLVGLSRSRGGLSANKKEEIMHTMIMLLDCLNYPMPSSVSVKLMKVLVCKFLNFFSSCEASKKDLQARFYASLNVE